MNDLMSVSSVLIKVQLIAALSTRISSRSSVGLKVKGFREIVDMDGRQRGQIPTKKVHE